ALLQQQLDLLAQRRLGRLDLLAGTRRHVKLESRVVVVGRTVAGARGAGDALLDDEPAVEPGRRAAADNLGGDLQRVGLVAARLAIARREVADGRLRLAHARAGEAHLARRVLRRLDHAAAVGNVLGWNHAVVFLGEGAHLLGI